MHLELVALQYQFPPEQLFYRSYVIPVMTSRVRSIRRSALYLLG